MFVIVIRHHLQVLTGLLLMPSSAGSRCDDSKAKRACEFFILLPSSLPLVGPRFKVLRLAQRLTACCQAFISLSLVTFPGFFPSSHFKSAVE